MKNIRTVILCFSPFVLLMGGVLGYGLWRKGAVAKEARRRAAAADGILNTSLADFVRQTPAEQTRQLVEARTLKQALDATRADSPDGRGRKLDEWIARRLDLRVVVHRKRRQLARLREELPCDAPVPAGAVSCRQVSSARAQRIRLVAKRADEFADGLTVRAAGEQVDLSPAMGQEAQRVQEEARRVVTELDRREAAFSKYVAAVQQAIADKRSDDAGTLGGDLDKWFGLAAGAADKRRQLVALASQLTGGDRSGDEEKTLLSRMDGLVGVLASSKSAREIQVAMNQCDDVIKLAEAFMNRRPGSPVKRKLQSLVAAQSAARAQSRDLARQAQLRASRQDTIDQKILPGALALAAPKARPTDLAEWQKAATPIRTAIAEVEAADSDAAFLSILLDATKRKITAGSAAARRKQVRWVGPRWEFFDANVKAMEAARTYCAVHGIKGVPWPSKTSPIRGHAFDVKQNFVKAHGFIDRYLKDFEKFKRNHAARIAKKQADEAAKNK